MGIAPDILVSSRGSAERGNDDLPRLRERDLEGHFTHEDADPEDAAAPPEAEAVDEAEEGDIQLVRAVEVLKSWKYFERLRERRETATLQADASP